MHPESIDTAASLDAEIVRRIEEIAREAERNARPLEVDPYRGQLFELFVTAEGAGFLDDDSPVDLSADGLCRRLATRFGLRDAATASVERNVRLPEPHLSRMRLLWSIMRMWMEWTYAWQRWPEFHSGEREID
jgi:hypothetical protein